jgi:hypothetical protein
MKLLLVGVRVEIQMDTSLTIWSLACCEAVKKSFFCILKAEQLNLRRKGEK